MSNFDSEQICSYKDIDKFGFVCDLCGRKVNGCYIVNGMKFCAKCYQETFGKDNQQNEIQQLKQQLEEKSKEIKSLIVDYEKRISQEQELMSNMEHQLAEKQNEIDEINKEFVQAVHDWKALCDEKDKEIERLKVFEKAYYYNQLQASQEDIQKFQQLANQSTVNINHIAITELEKVKEKIDCEMAIREYDISEQTADVCVSIAEQIDQQIKELKGEKDEN